GRDTVPKRTTLTPTMTPAIANSVAASASHQAPAQPVSRLIAPTATTTAMIASGILAPAKGSSSVTTPSGITTPKCTIDATARVTASTSIRPAIIVETGEGCPVMSRRSYRSFSVTVIVRARHVSPSTPAVFSTSPIPPRLTPDVLPRGDHWESDCLRGTAHPSVVRNHRREIRPEPDGGREMDGVERSHRHWFELGSSIEKIFVKPDEMDARELAPRTLHESRKPRTTHRTEELDAEQSSRRPPRPASQPAPKRRCLGFLHQELDHGRGDQVCDVSAHQPANQLGHLTTCVVR